MPAIRLPPQTVCIMIVFHYSDNFTAQRCQRSFDMLNLATLVETSAREHPSNRAVIFNDTHLTYAALNSKASQFANALTALGVERGSKVALMMPNIPYFPVAYYGILKAACTVVP